METEKENKLSFLDLDHVVHTMEIRDDTHMTPMKIVQCLRAPPPPLPIYIQNSSTPSLNDNQSFKRKHNLLYVIKSIIGRLSFSVSTH